MRMFTKTLDMVLESATVPPQSNGSNAGSFSNPMTPSDSTAPTAAYHGPTPDDGGNQWGTTAQWQEVERMRQKVKADKLEALSVDQKIDLALKQSENAERIAHRTAGAVFTIDNKLDRAFQNLTTMITRIGQGKPAVEPDPPGSSIFDDGDPESVFGR